MTGELTTLAPTPGAYPATGASVEAVSPQLITIADPVSGATASAYCIDFSTETGIGAGYNIGEWDASNVPNLDYINYILNNYFPFNTANPLSGLPLSQQVAAVQSAIWYFSDGFVLATGTNATIRNATAAVVQAALDSGGLPEPALPTLAIDPDTTTVPEDGSIVGPFTVSGTTSGTLDAAVGVEVFLDQAGTQPVPVGTAVAAGTQLWARWTGPAAPVNGFRITAQASLTQGTVYLYDTESSDRPAAQKLVLAQTTTLPLRTGVRATPTRPGRSACRRSSPETARDCRTPSPSTSPALPPRLKASSSPPRFPRGPRARIPSSSPACRTGRRVRSANPRTAPTMRSRSPRRPSNRRR
ncbi:hypothetical protein B7W94_07735 [Microbacterium sp. LEMMJ01]|nr:thioester domain-containing protein [Microbacterium sp. LEMMJ01]OSP07491.1 hypothetical protein B7W94_07735 [Microbacterium sp. LEMMJ01]